MVLAWLTVYVSCKAVERGVEITGLLLLQWCGGRNGSFVA